MLYLTEAEIVANPEIKRSRVGNERVPRYVLYAAHSVPLTSEDYEWARRVTEGKKNAE